VTRALEKLQEKIRTYFGKSQLDVGRDNSGKLLRPLVDSIDRGHAYHVACVAAGSSPQGRNDDEIYDQLDGRISTEQVLRLVPGRGDFYTMPVSLRFDKGYRVNDVILEHPDGRVKVLTRTVLDADKDLRERLDRLSFVRERACGKKNNKAENVMKSLALYTEVNVLEFTAEEVAGDRIGTFWRALANGDQAKPNLVANLISSRGRVDSDRILSVSLTPVKDLGDYVKVSYGDVRPAQRGLGFKVRK
jgi:hypothetical protein